MDVGPTDVDCFLECLNLLNLRHCCHDGKIRSLKELQQMKIPDSTTDPHLQALMPIVAFLARKTDADLSAPTKKDMKKMAKEYHQGSPRKDSKLFTKGRFTRQKKKESGDRPLLKRDGIDEAQTLSNPLPGVATLSTPKSAPAPRTGPQRAFLTSSSTLKNRSDWKSLDVRAGYTFLPKRQLIEPKILDQNLSLSNLLALCEDRNNQIGELLTRVVPSQDFRVIHKQMSESLNLFIAQIADMTARLVTFKSSLDDCYTFLNQQELRPDSEDGVEGDPVSLSSVSSASEQELSNDKNSQPSGSSSTPDSGSALPSKPQNVVLSDSTPSVIWNISMNEEKQVEVPTVAISPPIRISPPASPKKRFVLDSPSALMKSSSGSGGYFIKSSSGSDGMNKHNVPKIVLPLKSNDSSSGSLDADVKKETQTPLTSTSSSITVALPAPDDLEISDNVPITITKPIETVQQAEPRSSRSGARPEWDPDDVYGKGLIPLTNGQLSELTHREQNVFRDFKALSAEFDNSIGSTLKESQNDYIAFALMKQKTQLLQWQSKFPGQYIIDIKTDFLKQDIIDVSVPPAEKDKIVALLDPCSSGFATPITLSRFLKVFGPDLNRMPKKVKDISNSAWFQGYWDTVCAQKLLFGCPFKTFFVHMLPGRPDRILLLNRTSTGILSRPVYHLDTGVRFGKALYLIPSFGEDESKPSWRVPTSTELIDDETANEFFLPTDEIYPTLVELVNAHMEPLHWVPFDNSIVKSVFFRPSLSTEDAKTALAQSPVGTGVVFVSKDQNESFLDVGFRDFNKVVMTSLVRVNGGFIQTNDPARILFTSIDQFVFSHPNICANWHPSGCPTIPITPYIYDPSTAQYEDLWGPSMVNEGCVKASDDPLVTAWCGTLATYPKGSVGAECLCDSFRVRRVGNRIAFVLCDGCAWGARPREASQVAAKAFCDYLSGKSFQEAFNSTDFLYGQVDNILKRCHREILAGKSDIWHAGTTTLCGGLVAKLQGKKRHMGILMSVYRRLQSFSLFRCKW